MNNICFCTIGTSPALTHARNFLSGWGYDVACTPNHDVTHLLLPIPSMDESGAVRGGPHLEEILPLLADGTVILGGNLPPLPRPAVDLLQDEYYTAENAAITAHCALGIILGRMQRTLQHANVLIIGWGRIGKCLAALLRDLGADVTVAARKEADRAMLSALGFHAVPLPIAEAKQYALIVNTVPAPVLSGEEAAKDALLLDLASVKGIAGDTVLWERGLPGRLVPETSGALIAKTALRYALRKE